MKAASPLLIVLLAGTANASVDFTTTTSERVLSGVKFQQLVFHQDGRTITYEQPRGWKYSGDASRITLTPPDISQAEAAIEQSPLAAPQIFDERTMKTLQEMVMASVPGNSQNVTLVSAEKNPLMIDRQETFEVVITYQASGVEFQRSVLFLNLKDTQLRFRITTRKQDFEKLSKAFRGSIFSWQWQ